MRTPMPRQPVSRSVSSIFRIAIAVAGAMAVLFLSPAARTEPEGAGGHNPDNVLVRPNGTSALFTRWSAAPAAAAARTSQRQQRVRTARKVRSAPAAPQPPAAETKPAAPAWPNAEASAGNATLVPITVKTVREIAAPVPDTTIVFENELSDIDLAARPVLAATPAPPPAPSTDGRAAPESENTEPSPIFAMAVAWKSEIWKPMTQATWFEPLLLALAGALAALSAMRLFA